MELDKWGIDVNDLKETIVLQNFVGLTEDWEQ